MILSKYSDFLTDFITVSFIFSAVRASASFIILYTFEIFSLSINLSTTKNFLNPLPFTKGIPLNEICASDLREVSDAGVFCCAKALNKTLFALVLLKPVVLVLFFDGE